MKVNDLLITSFVSSKLFKFLYSVSTGTKAWLKAPSATSLRKTFGIFNMTTKTSCARDDPKRLVVTTSLIRPKILERKVQNETKPVLKNKPFWGLSNLEGVVKIILFLQEQNLELLNLCNTLNLLVVVHRQIHDLSEPNI